MSRLQKSASAALEAGPDLQGYDCPRAHSWLNTPGCVNKTGIYTLYLPPHGLSCTNNSHNAPLIHKHPTTPSSVRLSANTRFPTLDSGPDTHKDGKLQVRF